MSITLMLLMLSYKEPVHKDMELIPAPQVTCPMSLHEYSLRFRWWARKDVILRQQSMARRYNEKQAERPIDGIGLF